MKDTYRPVIGITIGDPAGIGPEIILKALEEPEIYDICRPFVIGPRAVLERAAHAIGIESVRYDIITEPMDAEYRCGIISIYEPGSYDISSLRWGEVQELAGRIAVDAIDASIELGMSGRLDAVCTAPVNKVAIKLVGVKQAGHTEIYRDKTGADYVLTMFDCEKMRVFHLSRHMSLRDAIDYATEEHILTDLERIDRELKRLGLEHPLIAAAGINPHCGEGGLFGDEEMREVIPAVEAAVKRGINAVGPVSPDTLFARGRRGEFDAILAMYHDQGHIPCKTIDLEQSVSVTLGLPFIRCSVDHGTAFDIAGMGIATDLSMVTAIEKTVKYTLMQHDNSTEA